MKSPDTSRSSLEPAEIQLTQQDLEDRDDFRYLLSIMDKQGASGVTLPMDYVDAMKHRDEIALFERKKIPEGSILDLYQDIIFDFDGVLYDSTYASYRATEIMLQKAGAKNIPTPNTVEDVANSYQAPFRDYYKRFRITFDTPEQIHAFRKIYLEAYKEVDSEHHTPSTLYPEVKKVLDVIRAAKKTNPDIRVHIISAGTEKHIIDVLIQSGIIDDFDQIHTECHDKTEMINKIAETSGNRGGTIMIGDLPSDIKDAQRVEGVKTIAVARGERERRRLSMYLPDYIVSDLSQLFELKSLSREMREGKYNKESQLVDPLS